MGSYFSKKKPDETTEGEGKALEKAPVEIVKKLISKWDGAEVKRALDDIATEAILESGLKEDMFVSNVKIVLGVITCSLALLAQFHPSKFPANYYLTLFCVLGYYFFNTALQIFSVYRERDVILFTHPAPAGAQGATGMEVSSSLPRFTDQYTLTLARTGKGVAAASVDLTKSVGCWITEDGTIDDKAFVKDVLKLLARLNSEGLPEKKRK